jgi:CelD/BcsL family acetyltransferase involved in cellulose biosynthesis
MLALSGERQNARLECGCMRYTVTEESLTNLGTYWSDSRDNLNWASVFVAPGWFQVWWQIFGSGAELFLRGVWQGQNIIGIAPLLIEGKTASFIGSADVCDYLDFVVTPGMEPDFFDILLNDLREQGINNLDLKLVRNDSTVLTSLAGIARKKRGCEVVCTPEDVSLEMDLPSTWEEYLAVLTAKQRHEVRRKMRRLSEVGKVDYYFIEDSAAVPAAMDIFLKMFAESRQDKATFLTDRRESFFRLLADTMADTGLLRLGVLELDTRPTAIIMCFDYHDCIYLYNSGYDPAYNYLSAGLLSKALGIKDSIQRGKKRFDFLKGAESYKYHLGGREVPLYRCQIAIR